MMKGTTNLSQLILVFVTLFVTCYSEDDIPIIQLWRYNAGSTYLPMSEVKSYCNSGPLVYLRLQSTLMDDAELIHGGSCSEQKTTSTRQRLQTAIENCYSDPSCDRVDLNNFYYQPLVKSNCSVCQRSACQLSNIQLLQQKTELVMEVICKKSSSPDTHLTVLNLSSTSHTTVITREQLLRPNTCQPSQVTVMKLFTANTCPKFLVSNSGDIDQRRKIMTQISQCIHNTDCESVTLTTRGQQCDDEPQINPDSAVGFYWSCASPIGPGHGGDKDNYSTSNNRYLAALVVVTILFILSLIALAVVIVICRRRANRQTFREYNNNNTRSERPYQSSTKSEATMKYQKPATHTLDDHRYEICETDTLPQRAAPGPPQEEELYEYMNPRDNLLSSHEADSKEKKSCKSQIEDIDGYLIPQS